MAGSKKPSVLLACPGIEPGGCERYAALLASDLTDACSVTVITPLTDVERHQLGLFSEFDLVHRWPVCDASETTCRGHEPAWGDLFATQQPDHFVLVANSPTPVDRDCLDSLRVAAAAASAGVPTTVVFQFVPEPCDLGGSPTGLVDLVNQQAWVCVSHQNRAVLAPAVGTAPDAIRVVPNGVDDVPDTTADTARKALRDELAIKGDAVVSLTAARLVPSKRHEDILLAAVELRDEGRVVHLVWAGTGPQHRRLEDQAHGMGMADQVHMLGFRTDMRDLLVAADLAVATTVAEGLSFAVLEAMAAAKPIVAADATSNRELIVHGETGLLATPDAPATYAAAVRRLLDDRALAERLGRAAQRRQRAMFTREGMLSGVRETIFPS